MARVGRLAGWTKLFLKLTLADIRSIPLRLKARVYSLKAVYSEFRYRKIYDEPNFFFIIIFFPSRLLWRVSSKIKAYRKGLSLEEFWKQEADGVRLEHAVLEWAVRQRKVKLMEELANAMPGATVNDFEELLENHFLSLRFLRNSLWELILGRR